MIWNVLLMFSLILIGVFSIYSVGRLFLTLILMDRYDELQKKAVYESFAITFLIILVVHLIQLTINVFEINLPLIVGPGTVPGVIIGSPPLHINSFFFDSFVLAIVYFIKKKRYGI